MRNDVDLRVHDLVALEEIELYAEVLSAVAAADRPLTTEEIDAVLGLRVRAGAGPAREHHIGVPASDGGQAV